EIGLTPRAKKVIELAVDEARRLSHHYIGTEHLLLGLIREGEGIAVGVLESLGVNLEKARSQTIQILAVGAGLAPVRGFLGNDLPGQGSLPPSEQQSQSPSGQSSHTQPVRIAEERREKGLHFVRGNRQMPKGHALFFARDIDDFQVVYSTYC